MSQNIANLFKGFNLPGNHILWMTLPVKQDVIFRPFQITFSGANGIVLDSNPITHTVKEFWLDINIYIV